MFVYANVFFFLFLFSPLLESLEAQCATRYHHSQPQTPSITNIQFHSNKSICKRTVNMPPEKKESGNFEKVIQFSDFLSLELNVTFFLFTTNLK